MDLNSHFSSSVSDPFLDSLRSHLHHRSPRFAHIEEDLVLPVKEHPRLVQRYLYLYTLPMLEAAGLSSGDHGTAMLWATVHLCLSLHLRTIDHILDADRDSSKIIDHASRAYSYLAHAQNLLQRKGYSWGSSQAAFYSQFYDYEIEVRDGIVHDFSSIWRRVSPLCVIPETYLAAQFTQSDLMQCYRSFLSWSLLHADCDDILKDLKSGCITPVTRLVQEKTSGVFHDMAAGADVLSMIKLFLKKQYEKLHAGLQSYPLWTIVLDEMNGALEHRDTAFDEGYQDDNNRHR